VFSKRLKIQKLNTDKFDRLHISAEPVLNLKRKPRFYDKMNDTEKNCSFWQFRVFNVIVIIWTAVTAVF